MLGPYDLHQISEEPAEWGLEARRVWSVIDHQIDSAWSTGAERG